MAATNVTSRPTVRIELRRVLAILVGTVLVMLSVVLHIPTASAEPNPDLPPLPDSAGLFTELTITGVVNGLAVGGFNAPADFDPLNGYPTGIPPESIENDASFAGTIAVEDTLTGRTGLTYCIDLLTETQVGVNYEMGDWAESDVPNLGFIGYILRHYFPTTGQPTAAVNDNQRAAAVQAAIWFLSDRYVLDTTSPIRPLTEAIVADALANGPAEEPQEPELTVTPEQLAAPESGEIVGPFQVEADGPSTIRSIGVEVFTDSNGENLLEDGDEVPAGATLWARTASDASPQGFVLERQVTVHVSTIYLYDGSNPDLDDAQQLVLAQETDLVNRAGALITPFPAGALDVVKTVGGTGAGFQGEVVIEVTCEDPDGELNQRFTRSLDARSAAGEYPLHIGGILAGSTCAITETANGDNELVNVRSVEITPETVTIADGGTAQVEVANTYDRAYGALQVTKTIAGEGAGDQGVVVVGVQCEDAAFNRRFTIAAGTPAGSYPQPAVDGIPAGTRCAITEAENGDNDLVNVRSVEITPETVTIADGGTAQVEVANTYDRAFGALQVTKTIAGEGAGDQGTIVVGVQCEDAAFNRRFTIAAGTPAGSYPQPAVDGIPAGTRCAITETANGDNDLVNVRSVEITPETVTIADGDTAAIAMRNTYVPRGIVPSEGGVRMLPATGGSARLTWAALGSAALLLSGLAVLLHQSRIGMRRRTIR